MKIKFFCTCGGAMVFDISPDSAALKVIKIWESVHTGEGHSPCDAKTASRNRRKQETYLQ